MVKPKATVGGVIKSSRTGYGFKTIFPNKEMACKYKSMMIWILNDDEFDVTINRGYYDDKEMK